MPVVFALVEDSSDELGGLAMAGTERALHCAMETMGSDRIMFSVDYPYEDMAEASEWFESCSISESDRHKIGYENAKRLLRL